MPSGAGGGRILDLGASVRSNTGGAALAAGLLIFFGFIYLAEPAAGAGLSLLYYTLRLGGLAMVAVSVWLSFGHLPALAADAAVSILVGALIALAGTFMLIDGVWWVQSLIILVSGGAFLSSGLRNGKDFLDMWRLETAEDKDGEEEDVSVLSASNDSPIASDLARAEVAPRPKSRKRIEPELIDRVFDPYFSTRDAGTGLGLANARRVVEDHGGTIEVSSIRGSGTTIRMRLPA